MAERTPTHPNVIAAGMVLVALGTATAIPVFVVGDFRSPDNWSEVATQGALALGYLVMAWGYWSWTTAAAASREGSGAMARPLVVFGIANALFAVAYLSDSWMNLRFLRNQPFDGWSPVVWTVGRVVTCAGFATASVAIAVSARALDRARSTEGDPVVSELVG